MSLNRRSFLAGCAASASLAGIAGCGSSSSSSGSGGGGTLTIGMSSDTTSLDPLTAVPPVYAFPAYDALIYKGADGSFVPDLATSWEFTDSDHRTLRLQIRKGVKFTDGSSLNAAAVVASLNRFLESDATNQSNAVPISGVEAVDSHTVDVHYSTAVPMEYAAWQLTSQNSLGIITSEKAAKNPDTLTSESVGIGPYELDPSQTTAGSVYTYVANANYFNQDAIKYDTIVMKPIQNAASRLSAIESGQIDWAVTIPTSYAESGKAAGLRLSQGPLGAGSSGTAVLILADRESGPLADERVRQAIALSIPRADIVDAVYDGYGTPSSSLIPDGAQGYYEPNTDLYDQDPDRARSLLAEAGYSDGFTLKVLDPTYYDPNNAVGQSLSSALKDVGITLDLVSDDSDPGQISEIIASKEYPAIVFVQRAADTYTTTRVDFSPGGYLNPFGTPLDETLDRLVEEAALADTDQQDAKMQEATKRIDELLWAVPIATIPTLQLTSKDLKNVPARFLTTEMNPFSPDTGQNWYTSA